VTPELFVEQLERVRGVKFLTDKEVVNVTQEIMAILQNSPEFETLCQVSAQLTVEEAKNRGGKGMQAGFHMSISAGIVLGVLWERAEREKQKKVKMVEHVGRSTGEGFK
jgi:hypothetical protein